MAKGYIGTASIIGGGALAACTLAVVAVTPLAIGPVGVTGWFVALFVGLSALIAIPAFLVERKLRPQAKQAQLRASSLRRGVLVGGYITVLLALSSLQQLGPRDAILLAVLLVLIEFYMVARR